MGGGNPIKRTGKEIKRSARKTERAVSKAAKQGEKIVSTASKQVESEASRAAKRIEAEARRIRNQAAGMLGMGGSSTQGSEADAQGNIGTMGMGRVGEEEDKAKKDKKKTSTLSKKKLGTKGAAIPLQSTKTIAGDASTKGVQI